MPIYKAVLCSLAFPVVATAMTLIVKYAFREMRIHGVDFGMAFILIYSVVFLALGIYMWTTDKVVFSLKYLI